MCTNLLWNSGRNARTVSQGFDEFMNLVMDDAMEIYMKKDFKRQIGRFKFELSNLILLVL